MTPTAQTCALDRCDLPVRDAYLCKRCAHDLLADLVSVPWLVEQLGVTLARLDRVGADNATSTGAHPMPVHLPAMQASTTLLYTLRPWAHTVADRAHTDPPTGDDPWPYARALATNLDTIRQMPDADQLVTETRYAIRVTRDVIDQPPRTFYAGPCACGVDLYCRADDTGRPVTAVIRCHTCDAQYDTTDRRAWLLDLVEDRIATVSEIARALPAVYGQPVRLNTLRVWINRGRLIPRAWLHNGTIHAQQQDERDRPLCRIGDVLDLVGQTSPR